VLAEDRRLDVLHGRIEALAQHVAEARGVQPAAEPDHLVAVAVAGLVEVAVQQVHRVRGRHGDEVVVVLRERRPDVLHDRGVVAREVDPGLPGLAGDPGGDDDHVRASGVLVASLDDLSVGVVGDPVIRVRGLPDGLVFLVGDVDEDEFVDDVPKREVVPGRGADRSGSTHHTYFRHIG
jgi:hypothetical protein